MDDATRDRLREAIDSLDELAGEHAPAVVQAMRRLLGHLGEPGHPYPAPGQDDPHRAVLLRIASELCELAGLRDATIPGVADSLATWIQAWGEDAGTAVVYPIRPAPGRPPGDDDA